MKPFDLEAAKRGEKLVTRDGREVSEFHCFKTIVSDYPCVAIIDGERGTFSKSGYFNSSEHPHDDDLFMAAKKRTVYVNIYDKDTTASGGGQNAHAFGTAEAARKNVHNNAWGLLLVAHPVEIEE
jgi:hypothetical protein